MPSKTPLPLPTAEMVCMIEKIEIDRHWAKDRRESTYLGILS